MANLVFDDELYDMTETVKPLLADYFNASYIAEEFPFNAYRTDLVFVQVDFEAVHARLEKFGHLQPILKRNRQKVYNWISREGPVTEEEFMNNGPYAKSYKMSILNWLVNQGYVEINQHENALPEDWPIKSQGQELYDAVEIPYHSTIFAVELKQKNWEYAIEQANRAYKYADFWYVCMDDGGLPTKNEAFNDLNTKGAGLFSSNRERVWEVDWSPQPSNRHDTDYDCLYRRDMNAIGQKERWRINEESLEFICQVLKEGICTELQSVHPNHEELLESSNE